MKFLGILFLCLYSYFSVAQNNFSTLENSFMQGDFYKINSSFDNFLHNYSKINKDSLYEYENLAISIIKKEKDLKKQQILWAALALRVQKDGSWESAEEYLKKALDINKIENSILLKKIILTFLGEVYNKQNKQKKSINSYRKLLFEIELSGNKVEHKNALYRIAEIYNFSRNEDSALYFFKEAAKISSKIKNYEFLIEISTNIAQIYIAKKETKKAFAYYYSILEKYKNKLPAISLANIFEKLAEILVLQKRYKQASSYYLRSSNFYNQEGKFWKVADITRKLGAIYIKIKEYSKAEKYIKRACVLSHDVNDSMLIVECYKLLSLKYKKQKNYKIAYQYLNKYINIKDTILFINNSETINELRKNLISKNQKEKIRLLKQQNKYHLLELEKTRTTKNLMIIISILIFIFAIISFFFFKHLQKKNKEFEEKNKRLSELNHTKDKFFTIIAHDLKSPFSALLGFSEIISENFEELSKEMILEYSKQINISANQLFSLLENLLKWASSQTGRIKFSPNTHDLSSIAENVIGLLYMNAAEKNINLISKIEKNTLVFCDKDMITTIIRNLITNALKFTFPGGKVIISTKIDANNIAVSISDTGIGISEQIISQLFALKHHYTTQGTSQEKGTGLGLIICKEFVEKHNGEINVKSKIGKGSIFTFSLPRK